MNDNPRRVLLTPRVMLLEFMRLTDQKSGTIDLVPEPDGSVGFHFFVGGQVASNFCHPPDLLLSLDEFSDRFIQPAVCGWRLRKATEGDRTYTPVAGSACTDVETYV